MVIQYPLYYFHKKCIHLNVTRTSHDLRGGGYFSGVNVNVPTARAVGDLSSSDGRALDF